MLSGMRRDDDPQPIQIVPADQSVFRLPVPPRAEAPRSRRPTWLALVAGAAVVTLVFAVGHRAKGTAVPATTTSSSTSTSTTLAAEEVVQRPPQIGAEAPAVATVPFQLVLTPSVAHLGDLVTASVAGPIDGGAPTPQLLTVDDQIGGFWRTLVWFVGAPTADGPFLSGVVLGNGTVPPHDVPVPIAAPLDPFRIQVDGLTQGTYRVCRRFVVQGATIGDYVCATLSIIP